MARRTTELRVPARRHQPPAPEQVEGLGRRAAPNARARPGHRVHRPPHLRAVRHGTRPPRSEPGRYLFSGAIRCGHCGKSMFGSTAKNKAYYRCAATRSDYAEPSVPNHPPTYTVREERIADAVDAWLGTLTDSEHLDA